MMKTIVVCLRLRLLLIMALLLGLAGLVGATEPLGPETLLVIEPSNNYPRHSEGDIVEFQDGRLCLVYSRFRGAATDFSPADLVVRTSGDAGRTWDEGRVLVSGDEAGLKNVMSVSIVRLPTGELLLFYARVDSRSSVHQYVRRSSDEFRTLSPPVRLTSLEGYHVVNNDRVVRLPSGRLIVPANLHTEFDKEGNVAGEYSGLGVPFVYYSDDDGRTWHKDQTPVKPIAERKLVLQENGVVELTDGRLWMWMRTWHDFQYGCYSSDGGQTWSQPRPTSLASPGSPATIERIPWTGHLLCVWNDHSGAHPYPTEKHRNRRTPLCAAISQDEGRTWSRSRPIETGLTGWFCYTSMTFQKDRVILSYMQRDESVTKMLGLKVVALSRDWLYAEAAED